jgi:hypothetical protein
MKPKSKWPKDLNHSQGDERLLLWFLNICFGIHLHDTLHHVICIHKHSFRHRIIIISHKKDRCFGNEEKFRRKKKKFHASLCTKRREGVFLLRLKKRSFVHSKADYTRIKETKYITRYVQIYISFFHNYITKIPSEFFVGKSIIATIKLQAVILQLRHTSASSSCTY